MISPLHGLKPPYTLPSDIVYFHDWRYVYAGNFGWVGPDGKPPALIGTEPLPPMHMEYHDMPLGIRLVAQPARTTDPVLTAQSAGEMSLSSPASIHEEGRYRMWYECSPPEAFTAKGWEVHNVLHYAESDDGMDWRLPALGVIEYGGSRDNNLVYGTPGLPECGYHGGSVFKDPSAPPEERYKVFHYGNLSAEGLARYRRQRPGEEDPFHDEAPTVPALFGGVSPDGLRFTPLPDPLVVQTSDTHNVCTYDVARGKYVAYTRSWFFNRRTIGRAETDDFRRFPLSEELFWPGTAVAPYELWYANGKTMMPGTSDYHLMFPLLWRMADDSLEYHLASSPDGIVWNFVPGGAVGAPGAPGSWDAGIVVAGVGLVDLPGDRIGVMYTGTPVPHKHPRRPPFGAIGWAWWPKGRLVALEAPLEGSFALWALRVKRRMVRLNFRTKPAGFVQLEALGRERKVLPGRGFDDCGYLSGDHLDHPVTWRGESDLGDSDEAPLTLRFRMRSAELFSIEFG